MSAGLLGIDIGTGSAKALIVDEMGRTLGRGSAEYPLHHPEPGWAEQDPREWWDGTVRAVRQARDLAGHVEIAAIGLSGQMHGAVFVDDNGQALRPAIIWADTRGGDSARDVMESVGPARMIEVAGSPVAAGFQAASIRWVQTHEPVVWERTSRVLLPKDAIRWRLTGRMATEPSDASSTTMLDVSARDWSAEILDAIGVRRDQLPDIVESTAVSGTLGTEAAAELGLPAGIPVMGGGADAPLAALAAGVIGADRIALTISTGSQVIVTSPGVRIDPLGRIHSWCGLFAPGTGAPAWYRMGATMVSGLALRWLRDDVFALEGPEPYARMNTWAAATPAGADGLVFLPYLAGERTPHMNPHARGLLLGLTASHGRGHLTRAVMEGGALALFDAYEAVRGDDDATATIVLSGGGAQSAVWRQIVADVFGMNVLPLRTVEQSALGAAMVAGAGAGWFDLADAARSWPEYGEMIECDPVATTVYRTLLPVFRDAYRKHVDDFNVLELLTWQ